MRSFFAWCEKRDKIEQVSQGSTASLPRWLNANVCFAKRQSLPRRTSICIFLFVSLAADGFFVPVSYRAKKERFCVPFCLVRETGLEPVRCEPHAPQTCASASSATLAYEVVFCVHDRSPSNVRCLQQQAVFRHSRISNSSRHSSRFPRNINIILLFPEMSSPILKKDKSFLFHCQIIYFRILC